MDRENRTNFDTVKDWMENAGQDVPQGPMPLTKTYSLRRSLVEEECLECLQAFADYNRNRYSDETAVPLLKELADVLVVVYGTFVAMGIDGDRAFRIVMRNNFEKLSAHTFDGHGKVIVTAERKAELKEEVLANLAKLIK